MAILARTVFLRDPKRHRDIILRAGEEPAPEYAALITSPDAWEGGVLPTQDTDTDTDGAGAGQGGEGTQESTEAAPPATKKTAAKKTAATRPARGRDAAEKGDSGA